MAEKEAAPQHAIEVRISIGANDENFLARVLKEMDYLAETGSLKAGCSGGWDGSYSVTIARRDISPDAYRAELEAWRVRRKEGE